MQLHAMLLRQNTAFRSENSYFWAWKSVRNFTKQQILLPGLTRDGSGRHIKHSFNTSTSIKAMLKRIISTALFALALTAFANAQRIAYVDVTAVLESLPEYQTAQVQLDKIATQWRQDIAVEQDKIKGMYSK